MSEPVDSDVAGVARLAREPRAPGRGRVGIAPTAGAASRSRGWRRSSSCSARRSCSTRSSTSPAPTARPRWRAWSTALLVADGLSVGTDTSPYLERFNERMSWNGEPIPDDELDRLLDRGRRPRAPPARRGRATSRSSTAAALEWFADVAVDVAVIEVGLGGRWDATNVVDGLVAVVTNVELDHVEYLGPTRADIAREKAGIVKPGATLVLGETDPDAGADLRRARPSAVVLARPRLRARGEPAGGRRAGWSTSSRRGRSVDDVFLAAARRAPGRQRGDRARGGGGVPRSRARPERSSHDAFASVHVARSARSGRARTARRARRHEERRRRARGARRARRRVPAPVRRRHTHLGRRCAARRRNRSRCSTRSVCATATASIATPPEIPRAREPQEVADAARRARGRADARRDRRRRRATPSPRAIDVERRPAARSSSRGRSTSPVRPDRALVRLSFASPTRAADP